MPLAAKADTADDMHMQSAFLFAKRQQWSEAIAHARAAHSKVLVKYFTWQYLKDPASDASFEVIVEFISQNPEWPDKNQLERRAEVALLADNPSDETLTEWFRKHPPLTNTAKLKFTKDPEALRALIRNAWVSDDYDKATETKLLDKYHSILRAEDHIHRVDRLLWEGKYDEVKRLIKYTPYNFQRLFQTRLALAEDKQVAAVDLVNVPMDLRSDAGLLYERIRWRLRRGDREGVRELLLATPAEVPYPEKWWPMRERQVRQAIGENNITLAEKLLARHAQQQGSMAYKEAWWLTGWIALEFRKQPEKAEAVFSVLFKESETPGSKARAAYWAGRAIEAAAKNGKGHSNHWFNDAAAYPTTFYGQLAAWEINKQAKIHIVSDARPTAEDRERFRKHEMTQLVYALHNAHETDTAGKFIMYLVDNAESPGEAILATRLGREINRIDFGVRASKKALQNDIISLEAGYPVITISDSAGLEKPLVLALTRQESEFFADAVSTSGAFGLMQLLPGTAKEVARKSHLPYSADRLFNPGYNLVIGSKYLSKLVDKFGDSYILAVASYNAGPGRVGEWIDNFGRPGGNVRDAVNWIEKIPTSETRNYVQHVLSNTEVYRFVLAGASPTRLMIAEDLTRQ